MKKTKMSKSLEKVCTQRHLKKKNNLISKTNKISKSNILAVIIIMVLTIIKISLPLESLGADETADLEISSKEQLEAFRDSVNSGESYEGKTVKLMADINLNGTSWNPIGNETYSFDGTFDGQGYTISGMQITNPNYTYVGLFGNSYKIKNLKITNSSISTNFTTPIQQNVGIISGKIISMENCYTEGCKITIQDIELPNETVNTVAFYIGGLAGNMSKGGIYDNELYAKNCVNNTVIDVNNIQNRLVNTYIGGIIGSGTGEITNCINNSELSIDTYANSIGGIIGVFQNGSIKYCYNIGNITAIGQGSNSTSGTGGISGVVNSNMDVTISNCYNKGNISSKGKEDNVKNGGTGGIIGNSRGEKIKVSNSFNTGLISGTGNQYTDQEQGGITTTGELGVGGIIGNNGGKDGNPIGSQIENCYNIGEISGDDNNKNFKGNIVGSNKNKGTIRNCYYKQGSQYGGYGENLSTETVEITTKTESEMKTEEFVNLLNAGGNEFYLDTNNTNDGYPIFKDITPPSLIVKYSETNTTDQDVTVTITSNEELQALEGWTLSSNKLTLTKTYQENTEETIEVSDLAGNKVSVKITITNIFKNTTITFKDVNLYNAIKTSLEGKLVSKDDNNLQLTISYQNLEEVKKLELIQKDIQNIEGLENFSNLEYLDLSNNNINNIDSICGLQNIKTLNLNNTKVTNEGITKISNLTNLEQLAIGYTKITNLEQITSLNKLKTLTIKGNNVENIAPISSLENLEQLNISYNNLNNIKPLANLTKLKVLWCEGNKLETMDEILNMVNLEELYLSGNKLKEIADIEQLTKLTSYDFSNQSIELDVIGTPYDEVKIALPNIIKQAQDETSKLYSEEKEKIQGINCQVNIEENTVTLKPIDAAYITIQVIINGGKLNGSTITLPGTTIDYGVIDEQTGIFTPISNNIKINEDVIAKVITNSTGVILGKETEHTFIENDEYQFSITNAQGEEEYLLATVDFIDKITPEYTIEYSTKEPTNGNVRVTIKVNEPLEDFYYTEDEEGNIIRDWEISEDKMTISKEFDNNIETTILISDEANNAVEIPINITNIKKEKPEAAKLIIKYNNSEGENYINSSWTNKDIYISIDNTSIKEGLTATYTINNSEEYNQEQTITQEGKYTVKLITKDSVGNKSENTYQINIDKTNPEIGSITFQENSISGEEIENNQITNQNVYISFKEGQDILSGHKETVYIIDGKTQYDESYILRENGNHKIELITKDLAGNESKEEYNITIDKEQPILEINYIKNVDNTVTVNISANEKIKNISGWNMNEEQTAIYKTYIENTQETITIEDLAGNIKELDIQIENIENVEGLISLVDYSTTEKTNQNVIVSIIANNELEAINGWNLDSTKRKISKEYEKNITENIQIQDIYGNTNDVEISINNIDKEAPIVDISYSNKQPTNKNVTVTITVNEEVEEISGWRQEGNKLTKTYETNTNEIIKIKDKVGNIKEEKITIENIDKQAPILQIDYNTTEETTNPVIVKITANEKIRKINGWDISSDEMKLTKTYNENTKENITIQDLVGNTQEIIINIQNIIEKQEELKTNYDISEQGYIKKVLPNTTLDEFKNNFNKQIEIQDTDIIKTGMICKIEGKTYTIIVTGDINEDGKINIMDLVKIKRHLVNLKDSILLNENLKAADINLDGEINLLDLVKIKRIITGIENIEE